LTIKFTVNTECSRCTRLVLPVDIQFSKISGFASSEATSQPSALPF
jgi:hypothetical protein